MQLSLEQLREKYKSNDIDLILNKAIVAEEIKDISVALKAGANPTLIDMNGLTALHYAASSCKKRIIFEILLKKSDVETEAYGITLLMQAAKSGNKTAVGILLQLGAKIEGAINGVTALMFAIKRGHLEVVELLLKKDANPNIVLEDGTTPLHAACLIQETDIVKILLKYGADPAAVTSKVRTVLDCAQGTTDEEIINLIESAIEEENNELDPLEALGDFFSSL